MPKENSIHDTVEQGSTELLKELIQKGALVDEKSEEDGCTALERAAGRGNSEIVRILLEAGADPSIANADGKTALHIAAHNGQDAIVKMLLKHPKTNLIQNDIFGKEPFLELIEPLLGNVLTPFEILNPEKETKLRQCITWFFVWGANVDYEKLEIITCSYESRQIIQYLNSCIKKADEFIKGIQTHYQFTTLKIAKDFLKLEDNAQQELLAVLKKHSEEEFTIDLELKLDEQSNALLFLEGCAQKIVRDLHEAVKHKKDKKVCVLIDWLIRNQFIEKRHPHTENTPLLLMAHMGNLEMVKKLLKNKANFEAENAGDTPLALAAVQGHHEVVDYLLSQNANPLVEFKVSDQLSHIPIQRAALNGHAKTVEVFLKHGLDSNILTFFGDTLLHLTKSPETVEVLLRYLDPNPKNIKGDTPLIVAAKGITPSNPGASHAAKQIVSRNRFRCIKWLIIGGAEINDQALKDALSETVYKNILRIIEKINAIISAVQKAHGFTHSQTAKDFLMLDNADKKPLLKIRQEAGDDRFQSELKLILDEKSKVLTPTREEQTLTPSPSRFCP